MYCVCQIHFVTHLLLYLDPVDTYKQSGKERKLGMLVARGTSVMTISPADGMHQLIENPFADHQGN